MSEIVQVHRLLVYTGPSDWVEKSVDNRAVKESQWFGPGLIEEAVASSFHPQGIGYVLEYPDAYQEIMGILIPMNVATPAAAADVFHDKMRDANLGLVRLNG